MNFIVLVGLFVIYLNDAVSASNEVKLNRNKIIKILWDDDLRRSNAQPRLARLNVNELPSSTRLLPGHSLIRPAKTMLKSAVKFPHDDKNLVYGNLENLGITFDKTTLRGLSSGFRKQNDQLATLLKLVQQMNEGASEHNVPVLIMQPKPKTRSKSSPRSKFKKITGKAIGLLENQKPIIFKPQLKSKLLPTSSGEQSSPIFVKPAPHVASNMKNIISKAVKYLHDQNSSPEIKPMKELDSINESTQNDNIIEKAHYLLKINSPKKKKKHTIKDRIRLKKQLENEKLAQEFLDFQRQIELKLKRQETLQDKSKRIQNFLNTHIPVMQATSLKQETSSERFQKVDDFLDNQVPGGKARLSLDEKTQYIEDFLNNRVPVFVKADSFKQEQSLPIFSKGQNPMYHNGHILIDLNKAEEALNNGQNKTEGEEENNANEILDKYSHEEDEEESDLEHWTPDFRRKSKSLKKYRKRDSKYEDKTSGDSDVSASSDYEKNPGNPFTIHRNKYIQNWMWNHFMDGDHMNINPFGPPFASLGPTGADLFFGRKWWYFNQDDYKPMG